MKLGRRSSPVDTGVLIASLIVEALGDAGTVPAGLISDATVAAATG